MKDERGSFARLFCDEELKEILGDRRIVQINQSVTKEKGSIRGLHFQKPPFAEMKIVRCVKGAVWDIAVDLRRDSNTFLKWHAIELSEEKNNFYIIPEGFAHGFQTLTEDCEMLYLHTQSYNKEYEDGLNPIDEKLAIEWPLPVTTLSERDKNHTFLTENKFKGLII